MDLQFRVLTLPTLATLVVAEECLQDHLHHVLGLLFLALILQIHAHLVAVEL